jgi:hypothetical protein
MQFDKLGLEKVSWCPIGLASLKFGVFPRWNLVQVMRWHGVNIWAWVHVIIGKCKVLPIGSFVEGELHLVINAIVS